MFLVADKIEGFKKRVDLWKKRVNNLRYKLFPLLWENIKTFPHMDISEQILQHLTQLLHKFDSYFPQDPRPGNLWILDPFTLNSAAVDVALSLKLEDEVIKLSEDSSLKLRYQEVDLPSFWIQVSKEYFLLSKPTLRFLLPFDTTYLFESGFSAVTYTEQP